MVDLDNILRQSLAQQQAKSTAQAQPEKPAPEPEGKEEPIPAKEEPKIPDTELAQPVEKRKREERSRGKQAREEQSTTSKPTRKRSPRYDSESEIAKTVDPYRLSWRTTDNVVHVKTEVYLKLRSFCMIHGVPMSAMVGYIVDQYLQNNWSSDMDVLLKLLKDKKI